VATAAWTAVFARLVSAIARAVAVMAMLAGMASPVGTADHGRSPADRLRPTHFELVVLAVAALGTAGVVRYPIGEVRFELVVLMAIHGLYPGSDVLILYRIFERLVRPVVAGLRTSDTGR